MSTSKYMDRICAIVITAALLLTILFMNGNKLGIQAVSASAGYVSGLFDTSVVHSIDIVMDDWDSFIENCTDEEYADCTVIIDGEAFRNAAIRAKGNTSLTSVESYGNDRYSFKIEFDHYDDAGSYHGLDKLCLNNIIQDNTYMKDYLTYQLMRGFGADAPLCSYSYITVNGEDWGLYLAVEGVEESFLKRNYGNDYGQLYKPDSMDMGGGRGNGRGFAMSDFSFDTERPDLPSDPDMPDGRSFDPGNDMPGNIPEDIPENTPENMPENMPENAPENMPENTPENRTENTPENRTENAPGNMRGSSDVSLIYTDDDADSYSNIFENAKTTVTDADKTRLIQSLKQLNLAENLESTVDIEEVIRYFVVHNFVLNFDSYTGNMIHNYYLYEKDGQLSMIPWDYNLAFGGFGAQSDASDLVNYPIDTPVSGGAIDSRPMLAWIFADEEYTDLYHQYFEEFIEQYFDSGYAADMISSTAEMIAPYVQSDPTKFCSYEEFEKGVSVLKEFCELRAESVSGQLSGAIPSTSDGQAQDPSAFVDASDIDISDMGSMNMGAMRGGGSPGQKDGFRGLRGPAGTDPHSFGR